MSRLRRDIDALDRATRAVRVRQNPEGTPPAIAHAQQTLNRAFREFGAAKDDHGDTEGRKQAANKAWRAAREAVYGVIEAHEGKRLRRTVGPDFVANFEGRRLGRPRNHPGGQPLTTGYALAHDVLHGRYFYDGDLPHRDGSFDDDTIKGEMERVNVLIEQAERDLRAAERRRRR